MRRRAFIAGLGGAAMLPFAAHAQQKLPTVGILGTASAAAMAPWVGAYQQRLRELGWAEGRSIAIELRWADGRPERIAEIAAEFARLKVNVVVTTGTSVHPVAKAYPDVPIIFAIANDPIAAGFVTNLARPGGNLTGLSNSRPIRPASASKCCARSSPASTVWQSWRRGWLRFEAGCRRKSALASGLDTSVRCEIRSGGIHSPRGVQGRADAIYVVSDPS